MLALHAQGPEIQSQKSRANTFYDSDKGADQPAFRKLPPSACPWGDLDESLALPSHNEGPPALQIKTI